MDKVKNTEIEKCIMAAVKVIARSVLDLFAVDQHRWSDRPCVTCQQISAVIGEPWGCYKYQERNKK